MVVEQWFPDGRRPVEVFLSLYTPNDPISIVLAYVTHIPIAVLCGFVTLLFFRRELRTFTFFLGLMGDWSLNQVLKMIVRSPRPDDSYLGGYGFPSSHSQFMFFFATHIALLLRYNIVMESGRWKKRISIFVFFLAILVAYSRVYMSVHTWIQVMVGGSLGIVDSGLWFVITMRWLRPHFPWFENTKFARTLYIHDSSRVPYLLKWEYEQVKRAELQMKFLEKRRHEGSLSCTGASLQVPYSGDASTRRRTKRFLDRRIHSLSSEMMQMEESFAEDLAALEGLSQALAPISEPASRLVHAASGAISSVSQTLRSVMDRALSSSSLPGRLASMARHLSQMSVHALGTDDDNDDDADRTSDSVSDSDASYSSSIISNLPNDDSLISNSHFSSSLLSSVSPDDLDQIHPRFASTQNGGGRQRSHSAHMDSSMEAPFSSTSIRSSLSISSLSSLVSSTGLDADSGSLSSKSSYSDSVSNSSQPMEYSSSENVLTSADRVRHRNSSRRERRFQESKSGVEWGEGFILGR